MEGVARIDKTFESNLGDPRGLESQLINECAVSLPWSLNSVWTFDRSSHINILELSVVVRLAVRLVRLGVSARVVVFVDSNVVKCAAAKGRSSSKALARLLSRLSVLCVIGGLYLVYGFGPTRLCR